MKRTLLPLLFGSLFFFACKKEDRLDLLIKESCLPQVDNPAGRSYTNDALISISYTKMNCGFLPLSRTSYWVYQDSLFTNGVFTSVQYDTLRFKSYQSLPDMLVWWEPSMNIGLPDLLYSNDSAIFTADYRLFAPDPIRDAKKEYALFAGDSIKYLTSFDDNAAMGRSVKLEESINTAAGHFVDCILYEKKAPFYRKDQVFYKPGVGVVKYISEEAPMGSPVLLLQQVSTLVGYHID